MKVLLVITSMFPYGFKEPFLENEIKYITGFDKIVFFSSRAEGRLRIKLPPKIECHYINAFDDNYKKRIIRLLFSKHFWNEIITLLKTRRFCYYNVKLLQKYYLLALNTFEHASKIILDKYDSFRNDEVTIYSYWLVDHALTNILLSNRFKAIKSVSRAHRYDLYEYGERGGYIPFRSYIVKNLDTIYAISQDGLKYLKKTCNQDNIELSRLGVENNGINPPSGNLFTIVSCSWCRPVKRVELIIDALAMISEFNIEWHHFGDGELYEKIKVIAQKKLPANVNAVFHGETSNQQILDFYKQNHIDAFINVSLSEGVPVSIMEAISFGIPAIATDVGGTNEVVYDGVNGFLLNSNFRIEELACIIRQLKKMTEVETTNIRKEARRIWESMYNAKNNYESFYKRIMQ